MKNERSTNRELLISYKLHNKIESRNKLVVNNIGLVYMVAEKRRNIHSSFTFNDLVQEGTIGMMKGIEKFDINKNTSFSTYIYYWIVQQIDRSLINKGHLIRLPAHIWEKINRLTNIENSYNNSNTDLDINTLCDEVKITKDQYNKISYYKKKHYSFTSYIELQDLIPSGNPSVEDIVTSKALKENLNQVLNTLSLREKEILELRFGLKTQEPKTLQEIGNQYNLTRERIRQIESKALKQMRKTDYKTSLKEYLSYV